METNSDTRYFKAWFLFFFVSVIGALSAGLVLGFIAGIIIAALGEDINNYLMPLQVSGGLAGLVVSFLCFRWSIKNYIIPQIVGSSHLTDETPV